MILLPTLIRTALGSSDLDYQVAPGLAHARATGMRVEEIAAKVVYLTDGDAQGKKYKDELVELAGVSEERIFSLPDGMATEDLLDRGFYLEVLNQMLPEGAPRPPEKLLTDSTPAATTLSKWARRPSVQVELPSKIAVAYAVIEQSEIRLRSDAVTALVTLHKQFVEAFETTKP